jgi:hypothetical protein
MVRHLVPIELPICEWIRQRATEPCNVPGKRENDQAPKGGNNQTFLEFHSTESRISIISIKFF